LCEPTPRSKDIGIDGVAIQRGQPAIIHPAKEDSRQAMNLGLHLRREARMRLKEALPPVQPAPKFPPRHLKTHVLLNDIIETAFAFQKPEPCSQIDRQEWRQFF